MHIYQYQQLFNEKNSPCRWLNISDLQTFCGQPQISLNFVCFPDPLPCGGSSALHATLAVTFRAVRTRAYHRDSSTRIPNLA